MKKPTPIFTQLILNIIIPVVLALVFLAVLNYYRTNKLLKESHKTKNAIITDEIRHVLEFQDVALGLLEARMKERMEELSNKIVDEVEAYISKEKDVKNFDLNKLREELGMKPNFEDIYIINSKGIVVNTTFKKDLHLNFFEFGEEHKKLLLNILEHNKFVSERFAIESNTRRLKKYTYQPTKTGSYIIELGFYNVKADDITQFIRQTGKDGEAKDGMDMALCIINFEELKLQYSGAHNHLYHVREKQLEVYKADRVPISFNPYTINKEYTKHELQLKKGDTFYIFSDGYTDQFGGPKNKKFGIRNKKTQRTIC